MYALVHFVNDALAPNMKLTHGIAEIGRGGQLKPSTLLTSRRTDLELRHSSASYPSGRGWLLPVGPFPAHFHELDFPLVYHLASRPEKGRLMRPRPLLQPLVILLRNEDSQRPSSTP
jgi:hypothetical protein